MKKGNSGFEGEVAEFLTSKRSFTIIYGERSFINDRKETIEEK